MNTDPVTPRPASQPPPTPAVSAQMRPKPRVNRREAAVGEPMAHLGAGLMVETILKRPENMMEELKGDRAGKASMRLLALGFLCYIAYGLLMGSFSGGMQWWATPAKAAGGIVFSALICLPSLYIFGCLARSNSSIMQCAGMLAGAIALSGMLLIGFLPVGWVFSTSTESVRFMGFLHLLFWFVALYFGVRFIRDGMMSLEAEITLPVSIWMVIFLLVCAQMTTTLRPLVGPAETFLAEGKLFFMTHWTTP
jgi:hypothetical protein